jgi:hypothetical protein
MYMQNQHFSFEEFKELFQDDFDSQEKLITEYNSFLTTLEQLDQMSVPDLPYREKAMIFRHSWQPRPQKLPWILTLINFFRQPALTFALGIVIGCLLMPVIMNDPIDLTSTASADELLEIEHTKYTQTYKGKVIEELYPQIENPKIVIERAEETSEPHRVVHGTLDDGEIYVVWNL